MQTGVITQNQYWQGHPDVVLFRDSLYIVYRESDHHMSHDFTRICLVQQANGKFLPPRTISQKHYVPGFDTKRYNCPRLSVIDDKLWIICDEVNVEKGENYEKHTKVFLWSSSDGVDWEGPVSTNITGIVPDRICSTDDGFLIATHTKKYFDFPLEDEEADAAKAYLSGSLVQNIWYATSLEGEWTKYPLCHKRDYNFCEASICRLSDGTFLALMRENSAKGFPAFACFSYDGLVWGVPEATRMFGCHRPVTGLLRSGNLLTTYREASHSFARGFWAKNTFSCLTKINNKLDFTLSVILPLDHDTSKTHCDSGYTGWVQLPDDSIFIVNYITNNLNMPYITWYQICESDF